MRTPTLGDRLTLALRQSGLKDQQVAERAGVKASWLSAIKNDRIKTRPNLEDLAAVAKVCGVPVGYLTEPLGFIPIAELDDMEWELAIRRNPNWSDEDKQAMIRAGRAMELAFKATKRTEATG